MNRSIGNYVIKSTLGSGLQGKVKLGVDEITGEAVALKVIDKSKLGQRELMNLFKEVQAMKRVSHRNIIGLREVYQDAVYPKKNGGTKNVVVIVLELATGGELFDFMMYTGCFPEAIAKAYFQQLVAGLQSCHSHGIYHRDIKPENLLLDQNFMLKIADFGLSAIHETGDGALTLLHTQCGTRGYMCPEILSNQPYDGAAADIWSAGVVLFIMIAGFPPFQIAEKQDWWYRAVSCGQYDAFWAAHTRSAHFSPGVMSLLTQIFVTDPSRRLTIEGIQAHPWFNGNAIAPEVLSADLQRRMLQVQVEKRQQKQLEKQRADATKGSAEFNPFEQNAMRSVPMEDFATKLITGDLNKCNIDDSPLAEAYSRRSATSVARYTCFYSKSTARELVTRISKALASMGSQHTSDKTTYKVKAKISSPEGSVDFVMQVFRMIERRNIHIVEVRRRNGSIFKFQDVYKILCSHLSDIICAPPKEAAVDPLASGNAEKEQLLSDSAEII